MIVLDTNVISELMRSNGSPNVFAWASRHAPAELFTTAITEGEIFYGVELISRGKRRDELLAEAEGLFGEDFAGRVLAFDSHAARVYSKILARRRKLGRPMGYADAQIAAITQVHQAILATRDVVDFDHSEIRVVNPWNE
jgi:predicted nucleic acid-binding protein